MIDTRDELFAVMKLGDCAAIYAGMDQDKAASDIYDRLEPVRSKTGFQFRVTPSLTGPEQVVRRVR